MSTLVLFGLLLQTGSAAAPALAAAQYDPPVLEFPERGLDDPAAYEGYRTRFHRDAVGNAFQIYIDARSGRVVHLWANAANESVGFSARDAAGAPAPVEWASAGVVASVDGRSRTIEYRLRAQTSPLRLDAFVLGSMRVEREFQHRGAHLEPSSTSEPTLPELRELANLVENLERLPEAERRAHLELLGAESVDAVRGRLRPALTRSVAADGAPRVRVGRPTLDGRNRLTLEVDPAAGSEVEISGDVVVIRAPSGGSVELTVRVATDAASLTPLRREAIFSPDFRRFYDRLEAVHDSVLRWTPAGAEAAAEDARVLRFRRLERQVRGLELVSYEEKLMAGLPNFATYFGRDMMMSALMMEPIWSPAMLEHVIGAVLAKLGPNGEASHEEALGGQAVREAAAEYNARAAEALRADRAADEAAAAAAFEQARSVLEHLQAVRENYIMVDDDFQLPVLAARYLIRRDVPAARKLAYLRGSPPGAAAPRLALLLRNLAYVAAKAEAYAREPAPEHLVEFPRREDGSRFPASWRDSNAGYAGGRFAMDVNAIWVPHALASTQRILDALAELGFTAAELERAAPELTRSPLGTYLEGRGALVSALEAWRGAARHFVVRIDANEARRRVAERIAWAPEPEAAYWRRVAESAPLPERGLEFLALSLDEAGRPIPVMNTDFATQLFLEGTARPAAGDALLPYPYGLFVTGLGPLVANDAYAPRSVWERFRADEYHSPRVVWGREVNLLVLGLAHGIERALESGPTAAVRTEAGSAAEPLPDLAALVEALTATVAAVEASGLKHNELWSYRIEDGRLVPVRYGTSTDVQLWNLTDLAVQYVLDRLAELLEPAA